MEEGIDDELTFKKHIYEKRHKIESSQPIGPLLEPGRGLKAKEYTDWPSQSNAHSKDVQKLTTGTW